MSTMLSRTGYAFPSRVNSEVDPTVSICSPVLRLGLAVWEAARGERRMPARRDLDPVEMPRSLLKHLMLVDVEHGERRRYRWRLIGTHITTALDRDMTGHYWDAIYDDHILAGLSNGPDWAITHCRPVRTIGTAPIDERSFFRCENLHLPLSSDGSVVDMLLLVSDYGGSQL